MRAIETYVRDVDPANTDILLAKYRGDLAARRRFPGPLLPAPPQRHQAKARARYRFVDTWRDHSIPDRARRTNWSPASLGAAVLLWRQGRVPARVAAVSIVLFVVVLLQSAFGHNRQYWLHVPIGVALVAGLNRQRSSLDALR